MEGAVQDKSRHPRITVKADDDLVVALKLAKAGYCGGDPERIFQMRVDIVMAALHYEAFRADYERAFYELNREEKA